jgi:hypothetical protein
MFTIEGKNLMLDTLAGSATHIGLLDENGNEFSSGGYARQPITWNPASDGMITIQGDINFNLPDNPTVTKAIFMSALTSGIKYAEGVVSGIVTFTITSINLEIV